MKEIIGSSPLADADIAKKKELEGGGFVLSLIELKINSSAFTSQLFKSIQS